MSTNPKRSRRAAITTGVAASIAIGTVLAGGAAAHADEPEGAIETSVVVQEGAHIVLTHTLIDDSLSLAGEGTFYLTGPSGPVKIESAPHSDSQAPSDSQASSDANTVPSTAANMGVFFGFSDASLMMNQYLTTLLKG